MKPHTARKIAEAAVEGAIEELKQRVTLDICLASKSINVYVDGDFVKKFLIEHLLLESEAICSRDTKEWEIYINGNNELRRVFNKIKGQLERIA